MSINMTSDQIKDFAVHVLPWIEKATKLSRNGKPLPSFHAMNGEELNDMIALHDPRHDADTVSAGGYSPELNKMLIDVTAHDGDWTYIKSIIVHELTHFLQGAQSPSLLDPKDRMNTELMAYTVQGAWLKYEKGLDPASFGLTKSSVIMRAMMS